MHTFLNINFAELKKSSAVCKNGQSNQKQSKSATKKKKKLYRTDGAIFLFFFSRIDQNSEWIKYKNCYT